ncbi:ABC transporter substrate-binding protein [Paenibacillus sp. NPDC058910]|uniref:ABC transporter substrate-binding protein n=1 Tax=unclassified Paenibacillus TaxID=185978 RepID=UPI0036B58F92
MKKLLATVLTLVLSATVFTGCGDSSSTNSGAATPASDSSKITLSVFDAHAYGLDEYAEMVAKFEEEHPGVKIEVQHAANDSASLLQSRVNANDIPDVFAVESGTAASRYHEYAYNWSNDQDVIDLFHPEAIATSMDDEGNVMSLPWTYENAGLLYNKDLFEQAGITELPKTLDELEEACKKLKAAGITAFSIAAKDAWVLGQLSTHFMMDKTMDADGVVKALNDGSLTFEDMPNFQNIFRFLDLAKEYGPGKPLEIDWETSENKLANNQAAIISMGDWAQSVLDSFNPDANVAFLPAPVSNNPGDATILSSSNWTYIVNKNSPHLELAKEYAKYILTSDMGQYWMADGVGVVPAVKTKREVKGKLANDAKSYVSDGLTNGWIHTIAPSGFSATVGSYLQAYMTGDMSAEEVTREFQNFWKS